MATGSLPYPSNSDQALSSSPSWSSEDASAPPKARPCQEACLILLSGSASVPVLDLTERSHANLGRQHENCVVIQDATCSRRHCALSRNERVWYVEDLFSRNGTFVNGQRIFHEYPLCNGDVLQLGCTRFQFTEIPSTDA